MSTSPQQQSVQPQITDPESFAQTFNVSRETLEKLAEYEVLLKRWQKAVNLVAPATLDDVWNRHFADSAQLAALIPRTARTVLDLGAGGGFPGLVLAILFAERDPRPHVTLVESDQRKAAFLREVAKREKNSVAVLSTRIETDATVRSTGAVDIISARALAPLDRLFALAHPYCHASTILVFPKGRSVDEEIAAARDCWAFDLALKPSLTDRSGRIAVVERLRPRQKDEP